MRPDISPSVGSVVKIMKTLAFAKSDSVPRRQIEYCERNDQNCMMAFIFYGNILSIINGKF